MAHPFLVAELARLSATNDQRCGRLLSKHALVFLFSLSLSFLNLFNPPHENIPDTIFAITIRNGSVVEIDFFMGQLFFPRVFQCRDYEKENFFIRVTQI